MNTTDKNERLQEVSRELNSPASGTCRSAPRNSAGSARGSRRWSAAWIISPAASPTPRTAGAGRRGERRSVPRWRSRRDAERLEQRCRAARVPAHVPRQDGFAQRLPRHPGRRRRHRSAGLGRDAAAHVPASGPTRTVSRPRSSTRATARSPASRARPSASGRLRLRLAAHRDRRAPPGAQVAVRLRQPPPHLVRRRCSSPPRSTTTSTSRSTRPTCASTSTAPAAPAAST